MPTYQKSISILRLVNVNLLNTIYVLLQHVIQGETNHRLTYKMSRSRAKVNKGESSLFTRIGQKAKAY